MEGNAASGVVQEEGERSCARRRSGTQGELAALDRDSDRPWGWELALD